MTLAAYQISAVNDALTSENRIHSDDIARKYGFTGALVSGVSVFGYLTHPLVAALGEHWFANTIAEVKFLKPAYEGDLLDIGFEQLQAGKQNHFLVSATGPDNALLAQLESQQVAELPAADPFAEQFTEQSASDIQLTRPEISWDLIETGRPAPRYEFLVSAERQRQALSLMRDELALYQQGESPLIHPYLLLKECNHALMRMFVLPAWIHVGSRLILREPVRVGESLEIVTVPIEKWERKGHQFIKLYIAVRRGAQVALEVWHSAIFRLAEN
ncbi:MAG: hypothetical protein KJN90_10905 [Gammaproteobacteria bacterium]|nr:hypothetical protein [Gammaproteobacteria bacterium]